MFNKIFMLSEKLSISFWWVLLYTFTDCVTFLYYLLNLYGFFFLLFLNIKATFIGKTFLTSEEDTKGPRKVLFIVPHFLK